ncbi:hypothetical protein [Nostoc sp. 'Peltigera membranacea cyanobiont' 232]|uniref:hypothetical protein n=1 Tax=Nostoc sp. 'Peltigera membranacea cyanobiont' 232 TaxID=2014531 RepID=UPI000B9560FD|nr:hypothetical protein [Nostoc sp. 'Peltigera membranacea cyanobiont' 232]OYE04042.1 hypothetical protein CDG79_15420 [Nostoc sp. 'Peltigera membranacea cyanobiont' 232]
MDCLLSLIRKPNGLMGWVSRVRHQLEPKTDNPTRMGIDSTQGLYEIVESPLSLLTTSLVPNKEQLIASWNFISCVDELDAETLFHVLVILLETVSEPLEPEATLPILPINSPKQIIKATAANPRAYKGTKYKPPKHKIFTQVDLRLYLCERKSQNQLLLRLSQHWVKALKKLQRVGYDIRSLSSIPKEKLIIDPYYAFHHDLHAAVDYPSLPINFHRYLWFSLQGLNWQNVNEYLSIYWGLGLDSNFNLLLAFGRLLSLNNGNKTLKWCHIITQQPESRRLTFTSILIENQIYSTDPLSLDDIERFNQITDDIDYEYRLYCLFIAFSQGISVDYMLGGFQLASKYPSEYHRFDYLDRLDGDCLFPEEAVEKLIAHLGNVGEYRFSLPLDIWEKCGQLSGFGNIILRIDWTKYPKEIAYEYLNFYRWAISLYPATNREAEIQKYKWNFLKGQVDNIENLLSRITEKYQQKAIDDLKFYYWFWIETYELDLIPYAYLIVERLAQSPFSQKSHAVKAIAVFITYLQTADISIFLNAPDASFLRLEEACYLDNNSKLIAEGIAPISKQLNNFIIQCFIEFPHKIFKVAKLLGTLNTPTSEKVVKAFSQHSIMTENITLLPIKDACEFIDSQCGSQFSNPIPRKIRDYVQGKISLSEQQINRGFQKICKQIQLTRLDIFEHLILNTLKRDFDVNPERENIRHALSMLGIIDDNFRSFRKFLKAYWGGNLDYLLNHPLTQTWLKKHSCINIKMWTQGIEYTSQVDGFGLIEIKLENEPLEVLKLGTYVGSCLALGGLCSYSAVAVLLDINKQVLYARNSEGKVVARQLVAISEREELVCFYIYPNGVNSIIKKIFYECDVRFAEALNLRLYQPSSDQDNDCDVQNIISQAWWEDDVWDFTLSDEM